MKLILFLLLLLSVDAFAQDFKVVKTIEALRKNISAVDGSVAYVLGYRTTGDGGGGIYIYSDTSKAQDDGGAIIKTQGLAGAWIHEVQNNIVNLKWWGVQPLGSWGRLKEDDIIQEFNAAVKFIHKRALGSQLVIDAGSGGLFGNGAYYCSGTWELTKEIFITGTKSGIGHPSTKIIWDARDLCINVTASAYRVTLEHLGISQLNDNFNWGDSTGHGIYSRAQLYIDNMKFLNLAGDGIRIESCATLNDPIYGNADFSILKNVAVNYTNHGLYIKGCDANKITVDKLEASNTRRWGVYDDGFLGNDYREPHFSATGYAGNNNQTTVNYAGKYYTPKYGMDHIDVTGKRPDLFPRYWNQHGPCASVVWDSTKRYWSAGTFALINDNAWHMMVSPYTEEGQAPGYLNTRSELRNGTRGTATYGGSQNRVLFGTSYSNANHVFPGILAQSAGTYEFPQAPLHAVQDFRVSGMQDIARFESMNYEAWVKIKNASGDAYINLNRENLKLHNVGGNFLGITNNGLEVNKLVPVASNKTLVWNEVTKQIGYSTKASMGGAMGGISQEAFDAAIAALQSQISSKPNDVSQSAFNALLTKFNSLDAIIATRPSKEDVKMVSDALAALTVKVNAVINSGATSSDPKLTQIVAELKTLKDKINDY